MSYQIEAECGACYMRWHQDVDARSDCPRCNSTNTAQVKTPRGRIGQNVVYTDYQGRENPGLIGEVKTDYVNLTYFDWGRSKQINKMLGVPKVAVEVRHDTILGDGGYAGDKNSWRPA